MVGGRNISLLPTTLHPAKVKESADNSSDRGDSGNEERRVGECAWIAAVNRDSQFAVLLIVVFVDLFSVGMVVPLIPYIADELVGDETLYSCLNLYLRIACSLICMYYYYFLQRVSKEATGKSLRSGLGVAKSQRLFQIPLIMMFSILRVRTLHFTVYLDHSMGSFRLWGVL